MKDLTMQANTIFMLADAIEGLIGQRATMDDPEPFCGPIVRVDKTCPCCGRFYTFWDKDECDGENELGLHYTCVEPLSDGTYCGSTMVYTKATKEQLRAKFLAKKAKREAKQ